MGWCNHGDESSGARTCSVFQAQAGSTPAGSWWQGGVPLNTHAYLALKAHLGLGMEPRLVQEKTPFLTPIRHFAERILTRFEVPFRRVYLQPPSSFHVCTGADGTFSRRMGRDLSAD